MNEIKHYGVKGMRWGVRKKISEVVSRLRNRSLSKRVQEETNILSKTRRLRAENDLYSKFQGLSGKDKRYAKRMYKKRHRLTTEELDTLNRSLGNKVAYNQELSRYKETKKNNLSNTLKRVGASTAVNLAVQKLSTGEVNLAKAAKDAAIGEGVQRLKSKGVDGKLADALGKAASRKMDNSNSDTNTPKNEPTSTKTRKRKTYMEGEIIEPVKYKTSKPKENDIFDGEFEEIKPKKQYKTLSAPPAILGLPMPKR